MNAAQDPDFGAPGAQMEIAAEASSDVARAPSFEDLWGHPARPVPREVAPLRNDRWPIFATIVAIVIGATAMIALREKIVRVLPASASAYRALGMPVNLAGFEFRDVHSRLVLEGGRKVLVTEGEIVNIRREPNRLPSIALAVRGANGLDRYSWTAPGPKSRLEPGEKIPFRARLASPPDDGAQVLVRFAKLEETKATQKAPGLRPR